jgi:hypothetical protein
MPFANQLQIALFCGKSGCARSLCAAPRLSERPRDSHGKFDRSQEWRIIRLHLLDVLIGGLPCHLTG